MNLRWEFVQGLGHLRVNKFISPQNMSVNSLRLHCMFESDLWQMWVILQSSVPSMFNSFYSLEHSTYI